MHTSLTSLWPVPVQLIALIATELSNNGISTTELLEDSVVTEQMLFSSGTLISYRDTVHIIERAISLSPISHLGFSIGLKQSPSSLGILGYAVNSCSTVEDVLNMSVKYQRVSSTLTQAMWYQDNDLIHWKLTTPIELKRILPCVIEEEFVILYKSFEMLTGKNVQIIEMYFDYSEPEYAHLYQTYFNCPLYFDAKENRVVIHSEILKTPILQANPLSINAAEQMCIDFLEKHPIIEDMEICVRQLILAQDGIFHDEEFIADQLNITSRTLRNKLSLIGTSYRKILEDVRKKSALNYLESSQLTISEIAEKIGYSDARSFRRAFVNWQGVTPADYRKQ